MKKVKTTSEFHFGIYFGNPQNQNFEKMKKAAGDVIILNLCNKRHNHMMHNYSDMECDRQFFILGDFLLFYPTTNPQN